MPRLITPGSVKQSILIHLSTTTGDNATGKVAADLLAFNRLGSRALLSQLGPLSDLSSVDAAHVEGGIIEVSSGNYRLDLFDNSLVAGIDATEIYITGTGVVQTGGAYVIDLATASKSAPISAEHIVDDRTHFTGDDGYRASNIITLAKDFAGTLSLEPALNPKTDILTVDSVSISGAAVVAATNLGPTADRKRANYTVPALSVAGSYTVVVAVTTTDGQTIPTTGTIEVV